MRMTVASTEQQKAMPFHPVTAVDAAACAGGTVAIRRRIAAGLVVTCRLQAGHQGNARVRGPVSATHAARFMPSAPLASLRGKLGAKFVFPTLCINLLQLPHASASLDHASANTACRARAGLRFTHGPLRLRVLAGGEAPRRDAGRHLRVVSAVHTAMHGSEASRNPTRVSPTSGAHSVPTSTRLAQPGIGTTRRGRCRGRLSVHACEAAARSVAPSRSARAYAHLRVGVFTYF
ncbi:hypothetical protein SAMN05216551_11231 [Chitinasiproducens palmae]|uniref:Uncharacterized protein n=1 Tax=Chitinasiproducens palmae TaxID=1770053 RepID=A0A1H2PVL8_9BURK|nr:hypothetical protein SAMN05216551_11231 [Chitinasiproducens palmae]